MIRLDPRRIKSENPILPVVMLMIKEFSNRDFSKLSPTIKCYNCQEYKKVAANYPSPKIFINHRVFIEALKPDSTISPKVTPVIKEFSVVLLAATTIFPFVAVATTIHPFLSRTLLSTPLSPRHLLPTTTVITCFPPLLLTPFPFPLWHVLSPKSKFSTTNNMPLI